MKQPSNTKGPLNQTGSNSLYTGERGEEKVTSEGATPFYKAKCNLGMLYSDELAQGQSLEAHEKVWERPPMSSKDGKGENRGPLDQQNWKSGWLYIRANSTATGSKAKAMTSIRQKCYSWQQRAWEGTWAASNVCLEPTVEETFESNQADDRSACTFKTVLKLRKAM